MRNLTKINREVSLSFHLVLGLLLCYLLLGDESVLPTLYLFTYLIPPTIHFHFSFVFIRLYLAIHRLSPNFLLVIAFLVPQFLSFKLAQFLYL